jgi:hypothetical protein
VAQSYALAGGINVSNNVFVNTWRGNLVRIDTNNENAVSIVAERRFARRSRDSRSGRLSLRYSELRRG